MECMTKCTSQGWCISPLAQCTLSWLRHGAEAGDLGTEGEAVADAIEARLSTGRPLADAEWIAEQEEAQGRSMARRKPGRKKREAHSK